MKEKRLLLKRILLAILILLGLRLSYQVMTNRVDLRYIDLEQFYTTEKGTIDYSGLTLKKGSYAFAFNYSTDREDLVLQVVSDNTMDADGNIGIVYAEVAAPSEGYTRIEVTFDQNVTNLNLRFVGDTYLSDDDISFEQVVYRNQEKYRDPLFIYLLWVGCSVAIYLFFHIHTADESRGEIQDAAVLILALTTVCSLPYMNDFLITGHDLDFHLARISGMAQAMSQGQFPVRVNPVQNCGYGYASGSMYPGLFLYIPAIFNMFGMSILNCYKLLVVFINLATGIASYISFRGIFNKKSVAVLGCTMYTMSIYRLDDLYIRASIGEALALAFLPLVAWGSI